MTQAGLSIVAQARVVLSALDRIRELTDRNAQEQGTLRLGILGFGMAEQWPLLRDAMHAVLPDVRMRYEELNTESQYAAVRSGDVDVAIVHYLGETDGLHLQPVHSTPTVLVVPATSDFANADRIRSSEVDDRGWVRLSNPHPRFVEWAGPALHMSRRHPAVLLPSAIPTAVATSGLVSPHGAAAQRYFSRPDVRFVPFDGPPTVMAVATRASDRSPTITTVQRVVDSLEHGKIDLGLFGPALCPSA